MPWNLSGTRKRQIHAAVLLRDGPDCHWCGVGTVAVPSGHMGRLLDDHRTLDHVVRRRDGGQDVPENIVIACHACNNRDLGGRNGAGLLTGPEFLALLA